jgi:hypothetical protein
MLRPAAAAVPEPSGMLPLAIGMLAIGLWGIHHGYP